MADEPAADELLVVGRITGCYGVKGWVKIHSYTEPQENLLAFGEWTLQCRGPGGRKAEPIAGSIEFDQGRRQGKGLVAHIAGVDDRTSAEAYAGLEIAVKADSLPLLEEGDFYWSQLQGLQVWCHDDEGSVLLGKVEYLIETGANDVLVVKACKGSIDKRERLIPYLPDAVVKRVDLEQGVMEVEWFLDV